MPIDQHEHCGLVCRYIAKFDEFFLEAQEYENTSNTDISVFIDDNNSLNHIYKIANLREIFYNASKCTKQDILDFIAYKKLCNKCLDYTNNTPFGKSGILSENEFIKYLDKIS